MIDRYLDVSNIQSMADDAFIELAKASGSNGYVNVIEVKGGWAIFGPYGVYQTRDAKRVFSDVGEAHAKLQQWGFKRFVQGGEVKEFPASAT